MFYDFYKKNENGYDDEIKNKLNLIEKEELNKIKNELDNIKNNNINNNNI
jgi:RNA polymerase-binding transcription factor DksA